MKIGLIITAAGKGTRFGSSKGKMMLPLDGKPIIYHSFEKFQDISKISQIIITADPDSIDLMRETFFDINPKPIVIIIIILDSLLFIVFS